MVVTCCSQRQCVLISQKNTYIIDENERFHKRDPLPRDRKINMVIRMFAFLRKNKCTLNAEGPNLACRWGPNLACQVCQARLSSFSGKKRLPCICVLQSFSSHSFSCSLSFDACLFLFLKFLEMPCAEFLFCSFRSRLQRFLLCLIPPNLVQHTLSGKVF